MAEAIANVNLGRATITFGGTAIGHTKGGVEITITPDILEINVDKYGSSPAKAYQVGQRIEIKTSFAESTLPALAMAIQGSTTVTGSTKNQINLGDSAGAEITGQALVITPTGVTNQVCTFSKAIVISAPTLMYKVDEENVYEVVFLALIDETKADGLYFGHIGDSD